MFNAKTVDNFLSNEEIETLLNFAKNKNDSWEEGGSSFWDNRCLNAVNIFQYNKNIGRLLYDIRLRMANAIKELYNLDEIYPDLTQIVRWFHGQEQHPHADDMTNTENSEWFHHRDFGAIIYLNNDYLGGHTYYPNYNLEIIPEPGKLAIHPGNLDHLHGVTKIENNTRYTIASFWTKDVNFYDNWII